MTSNKLEKLLHLVGWFSLNTTNSFFGLWISSKYQSFFYLPTDAQEFSFKRNVKIYIKIAPTYFVLITNIRERAIWTLLELLLLKQSATLAKLK